MLARDPLYEMALRGLLNACRQLGEPLRGQQAFARHDKQLRLALDAAPSADLTARTATLSPHAGPLVAPRARAIGPGAVQRIIEAAMDVIADDGQWPALLQRLTEATHGIGTLLAGCSFTHAQDGLLLTHGLDLALSQRFLERYQDNPWSRAMQAVPFGYAVDQTGLVPRRLIEDTPFHEEIIRAQAIRRMAVVALPMGRLHASGGISINFGGGQARVRSQEARRLLNHVAPYLQRATAALLRWQSLQQSPSAVLILAADARLLFADARADALLSRGDGLCLRQGRVQAAHPGDTSRLAALLQEAARALPTADHTRRRAAAAPHRWRRGPAGLRGAAARRRRRPAPARACGGFAAGRSLDRPWNASLRSPRARPRS